MVKHFLWSGTKTVGRETLSTGWKILSDNANNDSPIVGDIVSKHARDLIFKLKGRGHKRKARHASQKTSNKRAGKKPKLTSPKLKETSSFKYAA